MLIDELQETLKSLEPDIHIIKTYIANMQLKEKLEQLKNISIQEDFWQHKDRTPILKELQHLETLYKQYEAIIFGHKDLNELIVLFNQDAPELEKIAPEVKELARLVGRFKISLLLNQEQDSSSAFLSINSGAGGTESQDWASMLLRMYLRFCEREGFNAQVIDLQNAEEAGIKSATLFIKGKNAYGLLKSEQGIHRLVRISPFDANKRRHTSFAAVDITPEMPEIAIAIDPKDLRIDTYRSGGAGGQHVNKTESAIRITHIPSGIVVQCQNERSQTQNKETAMKMLMAKLAQRQKEEQQAQLDTKEKKKIEWGSQIRSYVLHPYKLVKDHRTDHESMQPDLVLDGDLMPFIESYLIWYAAATR